MRALYVEDNAMDVDLVRRTLAREEKAIDLEIATSIEQAIKILSADSGDLFDWLLLDLNLPDGDGLDVLRFVRDKRLPIVVIALTGAGDEKTVVRALRMGVDDYVVKNHDYLQRLVATLHLARERNKNAFIQTGGPLHVL